MKTILIEWESDYVIKTLPPHWISNVEFLSPSDVEIFNLDISKYEIYVASDSGYNLMSTRYNQIDKGFCKGLALKTIDKYLCRMSFKTMKDIPFTLCSDGFVKWPFDDTDKLIAKPVLGTGSKGIIICQNGDQLPNNGIEYIIEKYIDDIYPKVSVDGYVCDGKIDILSICDNIYFDEEPTKFKYLGYPSEFCDMLNLHNKFIEIVQELKDKTGCNNQIIDIEFFIVGDSVFPMEINPRILLNSLAIYEAISGYNPWDTMENLKNHKLPTRESQPCCGVVRYNQHYKAIISGSKNNHEVFSNNEFKHIQHEENIFTVSFSSKFSHTYCISTQMTDHRRLIEFLDENYKPEDVLNTSST